MYRILVPVDKNTDRAERQAEYVTSQPLETGEVGATVLHVSPQGESGEFEAVDAAVAAAELIEERGIAVDRLVRTGGVIDQILMCAKERDVDEIVAAGRERSGVAKGLVGSVSKELLQASDRPVVVTA